VGGLHLRTTWAASTVAEFKVDVGGYVALVGSVRDRRLRGG